MNMKQFFWTLLGLHLLITSNALGAKSDLRAMLPFVSEIKDQKGRNTCTIFTTVAMLETLFIQAGGDPNVDLSEEWVQYLGSITNASGGAKGSMISTDLNNVLRWGVASESALPYTQGEWTGQESEAQRTCGHLATTPNSLTYVRCLFGKFPSSYMSTPDDRLMTLAKGELFVTARNNAKQWQPTFQRLRPRVISKNSIKQYLDNNKPLALEINIFHGAWNTSVAKTYGIGRSDRLYKAGVVTYPETNSKDRSISPTLANRHAVQIIGYDDDIEVEYEILMNNGETQTFKRKGVYIFKNSWGTTNFGRNFSYDRMRIRGLGMILQDHVHDFGKITTFN